jgi:hypothetical protein
MEVSGVEVSSYWGLCTDFFRFMRKCDKTNQHIIPIVTNNQKCNSLTLVLDENFDNTTGMFLDSPLSPRNQFISKVICDKFAKWDQKGIERLVMEYALKVYEIRFKRLLQYEIPTTWMEGDGVDNMDIEAFGPENDATEYINGGGYEDSDSDNSSVILPCHRWQDSCLRIEDNDSSLSDVSSLTYPRPHNQNAMHLNQPDNASPSYDSGSFS